MNQDYPHSIHDPIAERQRPGDIPAFTRCMMKKNHYDIIGLSKILSTLHTIMPQTQKVI